MKDLFQKKLGYIGKIIAFSKSAYNKRHPDHCVIFNGNIVTLIRKMYIPIKKEKVWYGDLDLVYDFEKLKSLATEVKKDLYVLYEMDGRFENEKNPKIDNHVCVFKKDGSVMLGENYKDYFFVDNDGIKIKSNV